MSTANGTNNVGHGHVYKRPDGVLARCGGPAICVECSGDYVRQNAREHKEPAVTARTPSYRIASYLRDMVKIAFEPQSGHVDRVYEAAAIVEQHDALVAALAAIKAKCAAPALESDQRDAVHFAYSTAHAALKSVQS